MMKRKITLKLAALGIALTCLFACAAGVLVACNQEPQKRGEFYTLQAIKETRAYDLRHRYGEDDATAEDVNVIHYYGTYNGCIALMYTDKYSNYDSAIWDVEIAGVTFRYYSGNRICIWQPL